MDFIYRSQRAFTFSKIKIVFEKLIPKLYFVLTKSLCYKSYVYINSNEKGWFRWGKGC